MADIAIFRINYKSDFVLTINGDAGWSVPFCIKFWTGAPSRGYFVGFNGSTYTNCRIGDDPSKLVVLFDDHHLPIGELKMQIAYHTTIEEFPGSVYDEVTNARNVIASIDGTEYQVMLDVNGETAPEIEFNLPAYANEAHRIANEQDRQREFAQMQAENANAVRKAENVNAELSGTVLTVTDRNGIHHTSDVQGQPGAPGIGVPAGGSTGQVLAKKSDNNYDTEWVDQQGGGGSSQADWAQNDPSAPDYIKNKPTIPTALSQLSEDATHRTVSDTEKTTWGNKQEPLVSGTNIKTINNESLLGSGNISLPAELPSNLAYTSNDNGEGIIPQDGIRAVTVTSAAAMTINPDVVTVIDGAVGTAAITLQVPQDNLAHVWDILLTTDSSVAITFAMSNSETILYPDGFSIGASKSVEISVIGVGNTYYLRYGEFA